MWVLEPEQPDAVANGCQEVLTLSAELSRAEHAEGTRVREWLDIKALRVAWRGLRRTAVNMTCQRRLARQRRENLVRGMFEAGREVVDIARAVALGQHMDDMVIEPWRLERAEHRMVSDNIWRRASQRVISRASFLPRRWQRRT